MNEFRLIGLFSLALLLGGHALADTAQDEMAGSAASGEDLQRQSTPGARPTEVNDGEHPQPGVAPATPQGALPDVQAGASQSAEPDPGFEILGKRIEPGALRQFNWHLDAAVAGLAVPTPVLVAHGHQPGLTLCLVAAVHGDELNGVEIVRRIMFDLDLDVLVGNVVGIPIANAFGFLRGSRYLPDRRDLNRYFPGTPSGSMASRFAHALFSRLISRCNILVDIHTGSFYRTNLPQLRADLTIGPVLNLTKQFGDIAVLHSYGPTGSLRRATTDIGIPAVTMETGGPDRFQKDAVEAGARAIETLLAHLGLIKQTRPRSEPQPVFYESTWVRAEAGGILLSDVNLGAMVEAGQRLGTVTDPIENRRTHLEAPFRGRILGMAANQVVMPGFAAFHIGRAADERRVIEASAARDASADSSDDDGVPSAEDEIFDPSMENTDEPESERPSQTRTPEVIDNEGAEPRAAESPRQPVLLPFSAHGVPSKTGDSGKGLKPVLTPVELPGHQTTHEANCIQPPLLGCSQDRSNEQPDP